MIRKLLVVLLLLGGAACVQDPPVDHPRTSVAGASTPLPTATATPTPTDTPTASPSPSPTASPISARPNPISYVRVAFYGVNCPGGGAPDNALRQLPVGCKGSVTATPKKEDGRDVSPDDHGPDIEWELIHGEILVTVKPVPAQPFNRELIPQRPGPFMLCATVRGVMGCLNGEVTL